MAVENLTLAPFYSNQRNPFNYAKFEQIARDISTQWLTLDEITQQLNLFQDESQDEYLNSLELAVRMAIEDYLGFSIFMTKYRVYYGNPGLFNAALYLDIPEVGITTGSGCNGANGIQINEVLVWTGSTPATSSIVSPTEYFFDPTGNQIVLNTLPGNINQYIANPIQVTYTLGANPLAQYPIIKQAGLLLFTHLYNNRSDTTETKLKHIPFGVQQLLRPYKTLVM
jgi:hypothetical protein